MDAINMLIGNNREWAKQKKASDSKFFENISSGHKPKYLWIGCSDSRVPANEITGLKPGELFVHRNIANIVLNTDINCLSVLQYAIEVLGVEHVIVCGHYDCGGVNAALEGKEHGLLDSWLAGIKEIYEDNSEKFSALESLEEKQNLLVELNVKQQVKTLAENSIVRRAWEKNKKLEIHGLIYNLEDGFLKNLNITIYGKFQF